MPRFDVRAPTPIHDSLWAVEADGYQTGLHVRLRMTVVRRPNGQLWLYSPVPIDDALHAALVKLGPVREIVAPSRFHYLFAAAARERFPDATLWVSPGLARKRPNLPFDRKLETSDPHWEPDLDIVRLRGTLSIDEFVFFHRPSRTMICADALMNIDREPNWLARQLFRVLGVYRRPGPTRYWRWATRDRQAAASSVRQVLAWEPARILMAHGEMIASNATPTLRRSFAWLSDPTAMIDSTSGDSSSS